MGRVITIVAVNPDKKPADGEGDPVIAAVMDVLQPHAPKRAWHVSQIANILAADLAARPEERPGLIQIVGHGEPGILGLGAGWTGTARYHNHDVILDSNPHVHGTLEKVIAPPTRVWLLGCRVGSALPGSTVANGPTLLFDLCQIWSGCEVSAPVVVVGPEDFGPDGRYQFPERMNMARGRAVTDDPPLAEPAGIGVAGPQNHWRGTGAVNRVRRARSN